MGRLFGGCVGSSPRVALQPRRMGVNEMASRQPKTPRSFEPVVVAVTASSAKEEHAEQQPKHFADPGAGSGEKLLARSESDAEALPSGLIPGCVPEGRSRRPIRAAMAAHEPCQPPRGSTALARLRFCDDGNSECSSPLPELSSDDCTSASRQGLPISGLDAASAQLVAQVRVKATAREADLPRVSVAPAVAELTVPAAAPLATALGAPILLPRYQSKGWKRVAELERVMEMSRERVGALDTELQRKEQEIEELRNAATKTPAKPASAGNQAAIAMSRDGDECQSAHDSDYGVADHQLLGQAAVPAAYDMSRAESDGSSPRDSEFGLGASQLRFLEDGMPAPAAFSRPSRTSSGFSLGVLGEQLLVQADFPAYERNRS